MESYARVDACWAERACRAGCAGQYARADLDSLSAGDLESDVATRPAAIAAATHIVGVLDRVPIVGELVDSARARANATQPNAGETHSGETRQAQPNTGGTHSGEPRLLWTELRQQEATRDGIPATNQTINFGREPDTVSAWAQPHLFQPRE